MSPENQPFYNETKLMLKTLPSVAKESCFALKGGTAINFFVRNMPRLSVDIDLTYLPIEDRDTSLSGISHGLKNIAASLKKLGGFKIQESVLTGTKLVSKLHISDGIMNH